MTLLIFVNCFDFLLQLSNYPVCTFFVASIWLGLLSGQRVSAGSLHFNLNFFDKLILIDYVSPLDLFGLTLDPQLFTISGIGEVELI